MSFDGPWLDDGNKSWPKFVLAHGAGAAMDTDWMNTLVANLNAHKVRVLRFEFPYMAGRRTEGKRRAPDRAAVLESTWHAAIKAAGKPEKLVIGGKSMGGRYASMIAEEAGAAGVGCLGYPFHPPGKPEKLRTAHLEKLKIPTLIVQGTRDSMGTRAEIESYELSKRIRVHWIEDGDHSLKPRKRETGRTQADALEETAEKMAAFVRSILG